MAELQRLIYRSAATGTTTSLLNVATILAESQRNNDRDGLTGALAAHGDRYIQVIEGPSQTLDGLLRRLERDKRHRAIEVIDRRDIDRRRFDGWAMAHARFGPGDASTLERMVNPPYGSVRELVELLATAVSAGVADTQS